MSLLIHVKREGDAAFAPLLVAEGAFVSAVAKQAAEELGWGVAGTAVHLYLLTAAWAARAGTPEYADAGALAGQPRLREVSSLSAAGVEGGSCLVARIVAPVPVVAPRLFVKRVGDAAAAFVELDAASGHSVASLAERAALKLKWGVDASRVHLFKVPDAWAPKADTPAFDEAAALEGVERLRAMDTFGAVSGGRDTLVLARVLAPAAAAGGPPAPVAQLRQLAHLTHACMHACNTISQPTSQSAPRGRSDTKRLK